MKKLKGKIGLTQSLEDQMTSTIPLSKFGKAEEIAKLIAFLATDSAAFITGSEYLIDGGQCI